VGRWYSIAVQLGVGEVGCFHDVVLDSETDLHGEFPFSFLLIHGLIP